MSSSASDDTTSASPSTAGRMPRPPLRRPPAAVPTTTGSLRRPKKTGTRHRASSSPGCPRSTRSSSMDNITRRFGGLTAVDVEHLEIPRNAITALIGPNGAGKTTLFNLLCGFDKPNSGTWSFDGKQLSGIPSFKVARLGQVRTFQLTKALSLLTVLENMKLGSTGQKGENLLASIIPAIWRKQDSDIEDKAMELLKRFKLDAKADDYAASLSGGQRKLLEMARALMSDPQLVMLDEPMAGVNPALTESLLDHILDLKDLGMTVLFVEHDMHMVRHIADWVVVMAEGRVVAEGPPETVMQGQGRHRRLPGQPPGCRPGCRHRPRGRRARHLRDRICSRRSRRPKRPRSPRPKRRTDDLRGRSAAHRGRQDRAGRRADHRSVRGLPPRHQHHQRREPGRPQGRADRHHRPERRRQVDAAQGDLRHGEGARRRGPRRRRERRRAEVRQARRRGRRLRAADQQRVPLAHDRGEPADGAVPGPEDLQRAPRVRHRASSPSWASASSSAPGLSPAASARWSRCRARS